MLMKKLEEAADFLALNINLVTVCPREMFGGKKKAKSGVKNFLRDKDFER